jgi:sterol desaturase/sphingolipid hydroxylase (fatty acid hydroxylase superfamily)
MYPIMYNVLFPFYAVWLYTACSYYDMTQNKESYAKQIDLAKVETIFYNVYAWLPASMGAVLTLKPITADYNSPGLELLHLLLNIVFGEIWFYSLHRMLHLKLFYKFHKKHHEITSTVGLLALYAHPFDAIVVNMGSIYALHAVVGFSALQLFVVGSYATINTVLQSHSSTASNSPHQLHHLRFNVNYGLNLFMDKWLKTRAES